MLFFLNSHETFKLFFKRFRPLVRQSSICVFIRILFQCKNNMYTLRAPIRHLYLSHKPMRGFDGTLCSATSCRGFFSRSFCDKSKRRKKRLSQLYLSHSLVYTLKCYIHVKVVFQEVGCFVSMVYETTPDAQLSHF